MSGKVRINELLSGMMVWDHTNDGLQLIFVVGFSRRVDEPDYVSISWLERGILFDGVFKDTWYFSNGRTWIP